MNTRYIVLAFSVCLTIFHQSIQAAEKNRHKEPVRYEHDQEKFIKFYTPVNASPVGIKNFLRYIYNDPEYAQDFLPNDFSHLHQLLSKKQTRSYAQSVLRLFSNKVKACTYVNAHAFLSVIEQMPDLLEHYFLISKAAEFDATRTKLNSLLYTRFLEKFDDFKKDPTVFFDDLSQDIIDSLNATHLDVNDISIEELRKTTLIFLEVNLGKLIWCPTDGAETWKIVKKISEHLMKLSECNVIADMDDLNDLFVTLLERYCYFIDIASSDLPVTFYSGIQDDLEHCPLFKRPEQESVIEPKLQRFKRVLTLGEAKKRAFQCGVIT